MRRRSGPAVSYRRRGHVTRRRSRFVRRFLPCLSQAVGASDTDSEFSMQLSGLLDQHNADVNEGPAVTGLPETSAISEQLPVHVTSNDGSLRHEAPTDAEHHQLFSSDVNNLQLPLFRRRAYQRWHASFGQFDNLTSMNAADESSISVVATDADDLLVDSIFMTMFDSRISHPVTANINNVTASSCNNSILTAIVTNNHSDVNDDVRRATVATRSEDMLSFNANENPVTSSNPVPSQDFAISPSVRHISQSRSSASLSSTSSSRLTVRHYYDERFRPGGILSATRFGRIWTVACPPPYDDIANSANLTVTSGNDSYRQQNPPPPYTPSNDEPPAYNDVIGHSDRTSASAVDLGTALTCSASCIPFNGRLAVRWNRNMRVERWASSVNWITSS